MDPAEFSNVASYLNISLQSLLDIYTDKIVAGWAKMASSIDSESGKPEKCIFLGEDRKSCTIYPVRPNQCRTYPWWPRLLLNESNWSAEAVVPDSDVEGRKWTAEFGGCEGINSIEATAISPLIVSRNLELSTLYNSMLPMATFLTQEEEKKKFLIKTEVIQAVTKSTKGWIKDFVVKYNLCPFAESVFVHGNIRYVVFMGRTREEIINLIKFEMLHLLTTPEEETATTLIVLPFSFSDFEEYYEFALELEDDIVPEIEKYMRPEYTNKDFFHQQKVDSKNKLSTLLKKRKRDYMDPEKEIQVL